MGVNSFLKSTCKVFLWYIFYMNKGHLISDRFINKVKIVSLSLSFLNLFAFIFHNYSSSTSFKFFFLIGAIFNIVVYLTFRHSNYAGLIKIYAQKYTLIFSIVLILLLSSFTFLIHSFTPLLVVLFYIWLRLRKSNN